MNPDCRDGKHDGDGWDAESAARVAELEAVIQQLRDEANFDTTRANGTDFERGQENVSERVFDILSMHPSVVLGEHDREVAAQAVEAANRDLVRPTYRAMMLTGVDNSGVLAGNEALHRAADRLDERAAAIRNGEA